MSLNVNPLPVIKVLDPVVDLANKRQYAILRGGNDHSWQAFPSNNYSNGQVQITCNPPSAGTAINRHVYCKTSFSLTFTGIPPVGQRVIQPNYDAPRASPLAYVTNTLQVTLNNDQVSTNLNQYWSGLSRYHNYNKQREFDYSSTPSMQDQYQNYYDWLDPFQGGAGRNSLASYGINNDEGGRGGFAGLQIVSNPVQVVAGTTLTATAILTVTEPLYLSPFLFGSATDDGSGFYGIQNMSVTLTLGNLARVWSHDPNSPVTSFTVSCSIQQNAVPSPTVPPTLLLQYITPDLTESIPSALSWPYFEVIPYPSAVGASLAQGSSSTVNMNSVQLKTIPRRMYVFARRQDSDLAAGNSLAYTAPDSFAVISNLNISFNNRVGIMSSASIEDLYNMSVKNGLNMPFSSFSRYVGSPICVEFGSDIPLGVNEAPGLVGNYQLALQATISNPAAMANISPAPPAPGPINYVLEVVVVNEGTVNVINGSVQHMVGVFSQEDILNAPVSDSITYKKIDNIYGGSFFSRLREGFNKIKPFVSKALDFVQPHIGGPYAAPLAVARKLTGIGRSGGVLVGGRKKKHVKKRTKKGGVLVGGKLVSRSHLKKRAMHM